MIEEYGRVYASVDLDAIRFNVEQMACRTAPDTKIIAVIKTDGYGHGALPIAAELEPLACIGGFAVASLEEAWILKRSGVKKPVLILGYPFPYGYEKMIREEIRATVFDWDTVCRLSACAQRLWAEERKAYPDAPKLTAKVHIKVDTGMSRIGVRPDEEGLAFVKKTLDMPGIQVEGIYTHFARADEKDRTDAYRQLETFERFTERVEAKTGRRIPMHHCSNSAGILTMRDSDMDAVRAGIILYGLWPSAEVEEECGMALRPAMELKSCIVYIKEVEPGTPVSYGGTFVTRRPTRVATIPVGYGDGYPRGLSNKGFVLVRGRKAPVIGRVCMDQFMVDVTDIPEASVGDKVTLIGKDGEESIPMEELGELSGRFNYELACLIGKRVPRVYLKNGAVVRTKDYFDDF